MYRGSEAREAALAIATRAHEGQVDKGGHPYINHPIAVAEMVTGEDAKLSRCSMMLLRILTLRLMILGNMDSRTRLWLP